MPADPRDNFAAFAGTEHMLVGVPDPYGFIRHATEDGLRRQVPDTVLDRIVTYSEPKFLSLGKKTPDGSAFVLSYLGFCVRARLEVSYAAGARTEKIDAALTFLLGDLDRSGSAKCRTYCDLREEVERTFSDDTFEARFLAFRREATV